MKVDKKMICIIISVLLLYLVYKEQIHEGYENLVGQIHKKNNPENDIPVFYR